MGNIPSQQRYIYEREGAHVAMQLLQNQEVQHVIKSLGDLFRHHGDYIQHKRRRGRKKDKQERDERLVQLARLPPNGSYVESDGQRDSGYGKQGLGLNNDMDNRRRGGGGRRQKPRNDNIGGLTFVQD